MKKISSLPPVCFVYLTTAVLISLLMITNSIAVPAGDLNRDGYVDFEDLYIINQGWLVDYNMVDFAVVAQDWLKLQCSAFTATASSQEASQYAPYNAIDGSMSTRWSSSFADNQWLKIDMGQIRDVNGLTIYWEAAYAKTYNIQLSEDDSTWTTVYTDNNGNGGTDVISFTLQSAQYIKINCLTRGTVYGSSIWEVKVSTDDQCTNPPASDGEWTLVWSDEFDGTTLNTANWEYMIGGGGWGNAELEYYTANNTTVSGGYLTIEARKESIYSGYSFTSSRIRSKNKQDFLYGRMEGRIKVPTGGGMWPAFWMMPTYDVYGGWSYSGEIDIMETCNNTNYIGGALHYGGAPHVYSSGSYSPGGINFADDFHIYAIEWEPDVIRWYVDDIYYFTVTSATWYSDGAPTNDRAPFDQYFHFLLNVAVGGYYTGCTDVSCITATFPQQMVVDYVRVYQDSAISNNPPTVSITSPTDGANLSVGNILIEATASDSDGNIVTVEFYNGDEYLGEDTTTPYSFNWTGVTNGCYTIIVDAIDDDNAVSSDMVDITVGSGCPQYTYDFSDITSPSSSHKAADGEIDVDDATIEDGTFSARRDTIPGWALWAEATTAEYASLTGSDDVRYRGLDPGSGDNAAMLFEFYITQDPPDIIKLNVSVELGRASAEDLGWVYLWNYNTNSYTVLDSHSGTADLLMSVNILSNPGDYVEPGTGQLTVFVVDEDTSDWIQIDDISVTVYTQPSTTDIRGDLNVDGVVDFQDLGIMADEWLTNGTTADIEPAGGNGIVDLRDFAVLAENWLKSI